MVIKNAKIFDGEKFIEEDTVVLEGKFIKKITDFSLIDEKELENQEVVVEEYCLMMIFRERHLR